MNPTNWMRQLSDDKWLRQIVMPGSHDAGVYGTAQVILRTPSLVNREYTVCQHSDFSKQAAAGSRFFDCRVFFRKLPQTERTGKQLYAKPGQATQKFENTLGHFAREKVSRSQQPSMGGFGGTLAVILRDALEFVLAHPTEFIILRFSHTYHPTECVDEIKRIIRDQRYANAVFKEQGNLATRRIGDLRGKVIMVFDEKFNHHITPTEGILRFKKYSDGLTNISGLSTCGTFSSSLKMSKVHEGAMSAVNKHLAHPADPGHLHFVYWQQTAGIIGEKDVLKTTVAPRKPGQQWSGGAHANLADFAAELKQLYDNNRGRMPANVVSHDFVTSDTCEKIIRLNPGIT